jgi:uncharacterized small protein (DUF1192 family)
MVFVFAIVAGCGFNKTQNTTTPNPVLIGIIDMQQAIKAHPKYAILMQKQKEYGTLLAQIQAENNANQVDSANGISAPQGEINGLADAASQEYNARMSAKENELKAQMNADADQIRKDLAGQLDDYGREVDKEYQPQIFSLQLKLKTVQLTKDEMAAVQAEMERLQSARAAKMAAKQKELADKMNQIMSAKQAEQQQKLTSYGQQLHAEIDQKITAKQAEMAQDMAKQADLNRTNNNDKLDNNQQQLALKQQEINAIQDGILNDIRDKAAKVAAGKNIDTVLTNIMANVKAEDITAAVIAEFNK